MVCQQIDQTNLDQKKTNLFQLTTS